MNISTLCKQSLTSAALVSALSFSAASALAEDSGKPDEPHHRHKPPQEAYDACVSESAGDACERTFHEHHVEGTCVADHDGVLFCRPPHPPHQWHEPRASEPGAKG